MVGSAIVRRLQRGGYDNLLLRDRAELDLTDQAAVERFFAAERPDYVFIAAAKVGGIQANNTYPRRVPLPEPDDREQRDPRGVARRRRAAAVPRLELHLPARLPAADPRGIPAHRAAGTHQRALRDRQDRRHQAVRELQPPVRHAITSRAMPTNLYGPERQLRPRDQPRAAGADPQGARGEASAATPSWWCGARAGRCANSSTSTTWRMPACS